MSGQPDRPVDTFEKCDSQKEWLARDKRIAELEGKLSRTTRKLEVAMRNLRESEVELNFERNKSSGALRQLEKATKESK